ncbi:MAG: hypothetical protein GKR93_08550 [Gammaproteobacteria bacterium]|nr:hypothetical protein [Gammaproteobacteria bacterium]
MSAKSLFLALNDEGIKATVFKSWEDIYLFNKTCSFELDVYIPAEHKTKVRELVIKEGGCIRKTSIERQTEFYYFVDNSRVIMIHVAYKIITGERFKNCSLSIEDNLLSSTSEINGIRTGDLVSYTYYHTIKYLLLGLDKHWKVISTASTEHLETVQTMITDDFKASSGLVNILLKTKNSPWKRISYKYSFKLANAIDISYFSSRHILDIILTRLRFFIQKRGFSIAFVGVDGSGKSSLSVEIQNRLQLVNCKKVVYLGPTHNFKLLSIFMRLSRLIQGRLRSCFGGVTIYDRHLLDILAYRRENTVFTRLVSLFIPKPDFLFFCNTKLEVILARKQHENPRVLEFVQGRYIQLVKGYSFAHTIDTSFDVHDSSDKIMSILSDRLIKTLNC